MMAEEMFYDVLRQGLWISIVISLPILSIALLVGLAVGLFQALTSVQEMTLTFVPKLGAIIAMFWVTMAFMTETLTSFWRDALVPMIAGG
jgi:flagellar biosynthetic protein FliQ